MRAPPLCLLPLTSSTPCCPPTAPGAGPALLDLPPELLAALCALVDCRTVVRCRSVCRRLRDVIDASLELQYRIALMRDGMIDHRPASYAPAPSVTQLSLSDRLGRLRRLRRAWKTLDWTGCVAVPVAGQCCAYEFVGGIFCKTQPRLRPRGFANIVEWWPGDDDGFGNGHGHAENDGMGDEDEDGEHHVFGSRTMSATWLPGTDDPGRTIVREDVGIPTRDFAMDPSQDLMVLFRSGDDASFAMAVAFPGALELHVRTLSTNEAHPEARVPVLCTPVLYPVTSVCIQIVEDVVGMLYCVDPARPRITIWNWKTGKLVVDCSGVHLPPNAWDFSFINSRALFVTSGHGSGSLELFTFTCDGPNDLYAHTDADSQIPAEPEAELAHQPKPISPLTHVAILQLPSVHPSVRVLSVGTHSGPFLAGCTPDKPFVASNEERIHVLTVQYIHLPVMDGPVTRPRVCAFVHNRTLETYLEAGTESPCPSPTSDDAATVTDTVMVVSWSDWGRTHARMLHHVGMFQWLRYAHGQRVVMLLPASEAGRSTLQVLDFNPFSLFDANDEDAADEGQNMVNGVDPSLSKATVEYVHHLTRIVMPHVFVDPVESKLPYCDVRRDIRGDYSGMMIDDERLVGLKYPAFMTGDMKEVDVLTM